MDNVQWIQDLARRLELAADLVDDLANGVWVTSEAERDRLFGVEAQLWRVSRQSRKTAGQGSLLFPWLGDSLCSLRAATLDCIRFRSVEDDDAFAQLEQLFYDVECALAELDVLSGAARPMRRAAGGRS